MSKTFEVKGNLNEDIRTLLTLELGVIQSMVLNENKAEITVFDARKDIKQIFEKFGLEIIEEIE